MVIIMPRLRLVGKRMWNTILSVIISIGGLYVILVIVIVIFQSNMVYFPQKGISITPDVIGLSFKAVDIETSDGEKLNAWFIPSENPRGTVLFCHGNAGNISHRLESIEIFHKLGLNVFIFDYRGYGLSTGEPSEQGTYLDAKAAFDYLIEERNINPDRLIYFGRSLGGSVASWLARRNPPAALIIESAFTSIPDIGSGLYPYFPVRLMSRFRYNTSECLKEIHSPVLIVHSPEDEIIPFGHGQRLFENANQPKRFLEINGTHNEGFLTSRDTYLDGLDSFIGNYLEGQ